MSSDLSARLRKALALLRLAESLAEEYVNARVIIGGDVVKKAVVHGFTAALTELGKGLPAFDGEASANAFKKLCLDPDRAKHNWWGQGTIWQHEQDVIWMAAKETEWANCCLSWNSEIEKFEKQLVEKDAEIAKYKQWETNQAESYASLRSRKEPKCYCPDQLLTTWEDGKVICWECEWNKERAKSERPFPEAEAREFANSTNEIHMGWIMVGARWMWDFLRK